MPRGAIAKRSKAPGIAGPPGPAGLGPFAFRTIAIMAAFPAGALVDGVEAHVFTLDDVWSYDPSSTLIPDVTAYAPLGITIVAANGPGNWTRRQALSRRWKDRSAWFVDPIAGDDEAEGDTTLTAVGTFAEVMRRLQSMPPGAINWDVTIMSDCLEAVRIDVPEVAGLFIHAAPILLFTSAITAHVDYNNATQTIGTITIAGLPVSFTASGLVGKLAIIPSTGVQFWIMQDMGAKTARISGPMAGPFDPTLGAVTNVTVEIYDLVKLGTTLAVTPTGTVESLVAFQYLDLASVGPHAEFNAPGQSDSCLINSLGMMAANSAEWFNCSFTEFRAFNGTISLVAGGYSRPLGGSFQMRPGSWVRFIRFANYVGTIVSSGAVLQNGSDDAGNYLLAIDATGLPNAFVIEPQGLLDVVRGAGSPARLWIVGQGAGDTGLFALSSGQVVYDHTVPPLFATPAVALQLGNTTKTLAQLPYTNPIDQASMVEIGSPDPNEDYFIPQTVDQTAGANTVDLISQVITVNGLRDVQFWCSFNVATSLNAIGFMFLEIDGVTVCKGTINNVAAGYHFGAINWAASLAAGNHTIKLRMQSTAGNLFCRPVVAAGDEFSNLMIHELYG